MERPDWRTTTLRTAARVTLYVPLGNARSVRPNPFIPGAIVAVNMIVPVLAGIPFGRRTGLLVGLLGTALNAFTPAGSIFEALAVLPHGVMGFVAGHFRNRLPTSILAFSLVIGHVLNLAMFTLFGLLPAQRLLQPRLWYGIGYETLTGMVGVIIIVTIYRFGIRRAPDHTPATG